MYSGPHIKRDGLVFGYDTGRNPSSNFDHKNKKRRFFKGRAVTNVVTNTNLNTGWSKGYQTAIEYDEIKPPKGVKSQVVGFNKSSSSSYWYSYGNYAPQTPNTTYTVSIFVKTRDSNFRIRFYTANNSETGRVWGSYITVPNDNKWHRIVWPSFLNPSNSQSDSLSFNMSMASSGDSSRTWFCAPQMEVGTKASPFVEGSRSSTNSLIDLAKTTNIDVSNVSFDSTGQPTFDGTDDYIQVNNLGLSSHTMEGIIKSNDGSQGGAGFSTIINAIGNYDGGSSKYTYIGFIPNLTFRIDDGASSHRSISTTSYSANTWYHVALTYNASDGVTVAYLNGVQIGSITSTTNIAFNSIPFSIGKTVPNTYFNGEVPVVKVYNRALPPKEISQNFRAYKNRFNI